MAKLSQKILGKVSGSLGDITFRQRNGKNYLATRPTRFTAPQDEISINRRSRFALSVKLASVINSIPELKEIWSSKCPAGSSVYNYLVKTNYNLVDPGSVNENTYLVPPYGFGLNINSVTIGGSGIEVITGIIGTRAGINIEVEKNIKLISVICLSNPLELSLEKVILFSYETEPQILALDTGFTFNIHLSNQDSLLYDKYTDKKIIFTLITLDEENKPVHFSNTFSN